MASPLAGWDSSEFGNNVIDPFGGRRDLFRKAICALNSDVFINDPGPAAAGRPNFRRADFRIEPDTVRQLMVDLIFCNWFSPDRVRDEFLKILAPSGARALDQLGLLEHVIPELMAAKGVDQPRMHYWDVWGHSLHTVQALRG